MTRQTKLKYSNEAFTDMYEALKRCSSYLDTNLRKTILPAGLGNIKNNIDLALAKAEGK